MTSLFIPRARLGRRRPLDRIGEKLTDAMRLFERQR